MEWGGRTLSIEVGKLALQTHASCTARYGDTVILATVVKSKDIRAGIDYFPLMVDFEERLYAAGKIKGSRFVKREGRPSDEAILSGRLIDRAIRPLFDDRVRNDVQVVITALSVDGENSSAVVGLIAASCALAISPLAWAGPIAATRVGIKEDGSFILNATNNEVETGALDMIVAGTPDRLVMVEAGSKEVPEPKAIEAMKWGCEQLGPVVELIKKIQAEVGKEKEPIPALADDLAAVADDVEEQARQITKQYIAAQSEVMIFDRPKVTKDERKGMLNKFEEEIKKALQEKGVPEEAWGAGLKNIKTYVSEIISQRILDKKQRLDGRSMTDIRNLNIEVDLLPRVHGSAMFMRGDTQVVSIVTLGAPGDVQTLDSMEEDGTKRYMHHYNDAPFTYGEAGPMRGPGRRAIGHGALAERALLPVLPPEEDFPYAIRVVSEVMGSNGSSSMASTCGSSLSLMAAGVPIKKPVAGIAMGLASDASGRWQILTDLQDVEDGPGGMDFKIAGTTDGITAIQMDTKTHGLTWEIVEQTVKQAQEARLKLIKVMGDVIANPRAELSPYAPRIETIRINPEKIGDLIGPAGKNVKKIIEATGVSIDIEQDGRVLVTAVEASAMQAAIKMIDELTKEITAGEVYEGKVVRLEDFGAFVQILPNKDGMVHVSEISWQRVGRPGDILKIGDLVKVVVKEIDNLGRVNLSIKALLPKPEGYVERERRPDERPRNGQGRPGGRDDHRNGPPPKRGFFRRDK